MRQVQTLSKLSKFLKLQLKFNIICYVFLKVRNLSISHSDIKAPLCECMNLCGVCGYNLDTSPYPGTSRHDLELACPYA